MKHPIKHLIAALALTVELCSTNPAHAAHYSKLGIITAAKQYGKWDALKSWIAQAGYADEWQAAAFFSDDYPAFALITNAVAVSGIATPAEIEGILAAATDTAPDALIGNAYAHDMMTLAGRRRWHGVPTCTTRTNETTRIIETVETYPDGWEYIDPGKRRKSLTAAEIAERRAAQTGARERRIAAIQSQIAALESTLAASTDELEKAHAVIDLAAKRRHLVRLQAQGTNTVTVTITPQGR